MEQRINDIAVEVHLPDKNGCGKPTFWNVGCLLPLGLSDCEDHAEWQDRLFKGDWEGAWEKLEETNPFPEFTGRVCPALCEASCVLGINDEPVTIRQNELAVIEKAFALGLVKSKKPVARNGKTIAIIGGGPADYQQLITSIERITGRCSKLMRKLRISRYGIQI